MNPDQYRGLSEGKIKKRICYRNLYWSMFEENKQKIKYGKEGRKICLKETNKKFNNS